MFTDPIKNLRALGLQEEAIVADLGAGTGHYSLEAALLVPRGKVYAVELHKDFLETIKSKAKHAGLKNVEIVWGNAENRGGTKLADGIADAVIASNILFQVQFKDKFIEETKRILKKGGKVLLIDWSESPILGSKYLIPRLKAREMFEEKGFMLDRDIDAGEHHYGMILKLGSSKKI